MVDDKKIPQNRIAELRRENNLSQAELAKKTGLTRQAISLYEIGKREPKLTTWVKLADYFDVPLTYIQGLENNRVTSDDDFKKIMQFTLSHSSPKDLKNNLMYLDK
ncbi:helix-turn-helix domain-containing protein, partial [Lactobacillus reuteri]